MSRDSLPAELVAFLHQYIHSVRQLEGLLFLSARPDQTFTVEAVTTELRSNAGAMRRWLDEFAARGLVLASGNPMVYRFTPGDPHLHEMVTILAREYKVRPLKIIDVVVNRSTGQMMSFMNAFQIGKDGNDDGS